ncbi:class I SAM-dependent methyltransferase [Paenibacillus sp. N3/727]|uniref:class I SAM-dependent methyltransferase n=1 Tax=Paenibacillus sp. N3/727 TaxID=2925845 RepID=UPI001F52C7D5|nr:class I SAM-dependent methyltransferase [Paenibacillus sp. N3/727]UNK16809.1 class I SAM-dependent methyltransferase [Paenibacillus sp. N3/727]
MNYINMLSKLGMGSAHPGGFEATLRLFRKEPIPLGSRILEVGCGTGRTACHLTEQGYSVTAIDLHENMLNKARMRAEAMGLDINFLQADVCSLPFEDEQFDYVIAESVTVFTNATESLSEYCRVLTKGGTLYDRELLMDKPMPSEKQKELEQFFGIPRLMNREEWRSHLMESGFSFEEALEYNHFTDQMKQEQIRHLDTLECRDEGALFDLSLWETLFQHDRMILDNTNFLASALLKAVK